MDDTEFLDEVFALDKWITHEQMKERLDTLSDMLGMYEGIPVPLGPEHPLHLRPNHPMEHIFNKINDGVTDDGEPLIESPREDGSHSEIRVSFKEEVCEDELIVNMWVDRKRNRQVYVLDKDGRRSAYVKLLAPDRSVERFDLWMMTLGSSDAWTIDAEVKAMELLHSMTTEHQFRHYLLTGSFLETSERSGLTYLFRKLRPTIAISPRNEPGNDSIKVLAALCLHPIGYYENSWAGCMVPTDDVIAHLTMMRGDEAHYWSKSIQHKPYEPEAGI